MYEGRLDIDVLLTSLDRAVTSLRIVTVTSTVAMAMLMEGGPHDDVNQDPEARGYQHGLSLHLVVPSDDPVDGSVDQDTRDHPNQLH